MQNIWVTQVFPLLPEDELHLVCLDRVCGNVLSDELFNLVVITKSIKAKNVFEIGTFNGSTALNFAKNIDGDVFTLDLPNEYSFDDTTFDVDEKEQKFFLSKNVGYKFAGQNNIHQLYGDSAIFDFSPYYKSMDVVFVDASHVYDYVKSDTENAFKIIKDTGVIIWHDYGNEFPDVKLFLDEFCKTMPDWEFYHLNYTLMVCAKKKAIL